MREKRAVLFISILLIFVVLNSLFVVAEELAEGLEAGDVKDIEETKEEDADVEIVEDTGAVESEEEDSDAGSLEGEETDSAGSENEQLEGASEEYKDAQLEKGAGITPDSSFYFVEDKILSNFRGDLGNREKKIAEIKEMIREGNIEAARESLERYYEYAEDLEKEADPETRDEARRSAAAIRNALKEIESEIPEGDRDEFVKDVLNRENSIVTATEISSKIKELCESLSKIDPVEYSRVCKLEGDAPRWQKKMNKELTAEQETEAKEFFGIMSQCFENPRECRCEDISISAFADKCKVIAPLVVKCEEGDESACEEMEEQGDPGELLPEHLREVLASLEDDYGESQNDLHMPRECQEAGATDRESCMEVMFRNNAPEECVEAIDRGEIDFSNERKAREQCEEIMFKASAPEECIQAGLKDPKECGKLMFETNAPQECIDAGLNGENRNDHRKCDEIIKKLEGQQEDRRGPREGGFGGGNCRNVQDSEERLKCFDGAAQGAGDYEERFRETKGREQECAQSCSQRGGRWDFSNGECSCHVDEERRDDRRMDERREEFRPDRREEFRPPEGENFGSPPSGEFGEQPRGEPEIFGTGEGSGVSGGGESSSGSGSGSSGSGESSSGGSSGSGGGGASLRGNRRGVGGEGSGGWSAGR